MIKYVCNGCHKDLPDEEVSDAYQSIRNWIGENSSRQIIVKTKGQDDLFCANCQPFAFSYWDEKYAKVEELNTLWTRTLQNHQRNFFSNLRKLDSEDTESLRPN